VHAAEGHGTGVVLVVVPDEPLPGLPEVEPVPPPLLPVVGAPEPPPLDEPEPDAGVPDVLPDVTPLPPPLLVEPEPDAALPEVPLLPDVEVDPDPDPPVVPELGPVLFGLLAHATTEKSPTNPAHFTPVNFMVRYPCHFGGRNQSRSGG
jgi:hypothetical protein